MCLMSWAPHCSCVVADLECGGPGGPCSTGAVGISPDTVAWCCVVRCCVGLAWCGAEWCSEVWQLGAMCFVSSSTRRQGQAPER